MIKNAGAEFLLAHLFPERDMEWRVHKTGCFSRNFSQDILELDGKTGDVSVSRDSVVDLLPRDLVSPEFELAKSDTRGKKVRKEIKAKYDEIHRRVNLLREAFLPCDTFQFRHRMRLERQLESMLGMKLSFIFKDFFDFDIDAEKNQYVRQAALLLPYAAKIRGNLSIIRNILSSISECDVRMVVSRYGISDNMLFGIQKVRYDLMIDGLTSVTYAEREKELRPFLSFVEERFIPFDVVCEMVIKGKNPTDKLLDYNSYV